MLEIQRPFMLSFTCHFGGFQVLCSDPGADLAPLACWYAPSRRGICLDVPLQPQLCTHPTITPSAAEHLDLPPDAPQIGLHLHDKMGGACMSSNGMVILNG